MPTFKLTLVASVLCGWAASANAGCNSSVLSVIKWSIKPLNETNNRLTLDMMSRSPQPIRMIDASVLFEDALGGSVVSVGVDRDAAIPANGNFTQSNDWGPYTVERLLKLKSSEVRTTVCVEAVLYEDGTKQQF